MKAAHKLLLLGIALFMTQGNILGQETILLDDPNADIPQVSQELSAVNTLYFEGDNASNQMFLPQDAAQPYVVANPFSGSAPLTVTLQVAGMEQATFWLWQLDQEGDGDVDARGYGTPIVQVTYDQPGSYVPSFTFYDEGNRIIANAKGFLTVIGQGLSGETGTQSQGLSVSPSGWGLLGDTPGSGGRRTPVELGVGNLTRPKEEFSEDLLPKLRLFPERGSAPLTVRFDASETYARYGVYRYNYDIAWGPDDAPDDGYYLVSGSDPSWTHTFDKYGSYLVILDVEDNRGETSRVTKVVFVLEPGLSPTARISANRTSGQAPLTVMFTVQPAVERQEHKAAYAYWDFDLSDFEPPKGGDLAVYKNIVHTYDRPGSYVAGVILTDVDGNAGSMVRMGINVTSSDGSTAGQGEAVG
jgi:PKD repeat protein